MFEHLTDRLSCTLRNICGRGRLTEENIKEVLHEVRVSLLEADVALPVVRNFINFVKEKAIGHEINKNLTPGEAFIKIVKDGLISAMGEVNTHLNLATKPPAVFLLAGLQGVGKTTSVAKIGHFLHKQYRKKVLVVSADIYRPAAMKQLESLAEAAGIDFFNSDRKETPIDIVTSALQKAKVKFYDILIVDTAGRLQTNKVMMEEIKQIHLAINPVETLFVADAMTGQDATNVAKKFNDLLPLTGVVLTKTDGDARGGVALSIRYITGKPIKFLSIGEKINDLEFFDPNRIALRILGMGDLRSLVEDIENKIDHKKVEKLSNQLKVGGCFDLNDFLEQLQQIRSMDSVASVFSKLPGLSQFPVNANKQIDGQLLLHMEAILNSMTKKERSSPKIIKGSQKRRIAMGSGMQVQDVNFVLKRFYHMEQIMRDFKKRGMHHLRHGIKSMIKPGVFIK